MCIHVSALMTSVFYACHMCSYLDHESVNKEVLSTLSMEALEHRTCFPNTMNGVAKIQAQLQCGAALIPNS